MTYEIVTNRLSEYTEEYHTEKFIKNKIKHFHNYNMKVQELLSGNNHLLKMQSL